MSSFVEREVRCPSCGATEERSLARGLNARTDVHRAAILADTFQRFTCVCGARFAVDDTFMYMDFRRRHWIAVFPAAREAAWKGAEPVAWETFRRHMLEHAPPVARQMSDGFQVRAVFGLVALRDKLACFDAGLDDGLLALLKIDLLRGEAGLPFHPDARPWLQRVDETTLYFTSGRDGVEVPRERYTRIRDDVVEWARPLEAVTAGPYVDPGRVMIGGG